jgi:formylmethanofuran dehydrogenase subunit E
MTNKLIKDRLFAIVDQCDTQREAARLLGATEQYISTLAKTYGITKWRQANRVHTKIKQEQKICEECGEVFTRLVLNQSPGRFCSKKCQGRWLGKNHGFKKGRKNSKSNK